MSLTQAAIRTGAHACIYCGSPGPTVEHMPPRIMFTAKDRPTGLEFPSCELCQRATSQADQIAAFVCRFYDGEGDREAEDFKKLLGAMKNNHPALIATMQLPRATSKRLARQHGFSADDAGFVDARQPTIRSALDILSAKLGFALFHEENGNAVVPAEGGVYSLWRPILGGWPEPFDMLRPFFGSEQLLKQGRKISKGQFSYQLSRTIEGHFVVLTKLRAQFEVLTVVGTTSAFFDWARKHEIGTTHQLGDLQTSSVAAPSTPFWSAAAYRPAHRTRSGQWRW